MKFQHAAAGAMLATLSSLALALPISSSFDADTEGWLAVSGATNFHWIATGGQSGGYVRATDTLDDNIWLFVAPAAYKGDKSSFYDGSLSFYLKQFTPPDPVEQNFGDVKIIGNGITITADVGDDPGADWTFYSVDLKPGAWHLDSIDGALATAADIHTALANLDSLRIRGEYSRGLDVDGLDTVILSAPAIPEPQSYALMLAGLGVLGFLARRRR